ncbi:MAG: dihydropteroate synthase [Nannocystaceae bacterium]|nr:dihydropteroate synthase [Nannocystaceae bacterium]
MQADVCFSDLIGEVTQELAVCVEAAVSAGLNRARIVVDPGIGFGKTAEQSAALIGASVWLREAMHCPVMIGASRKSFLETLVADAPATQTRTRSDADPRLVGSLAAAVVGAHRGASVIRVHDVAQTVQALAVAGAIGAAWMTFSSRAARAPGGSR